MGVCRDGGEKISRFEVEMADRMIMFARSPGNELDFLQAHEEEGGGVLFAPESKDAPDS